MVTDQNKQTKKFEKASLLDRFKLGYELNVTWQDAKREVKARTLR